MATSKRQTDSEYAKRYAEKRKSKKVTIEFYLDDPVEQHIYETLQKEENKKQLFIKLYADYLRSKEI